MKRVLLLSICAVSVAAGSLLAHQNNTQQTTSLLAQLDQCHKALGPKLQGFLKDYATWSQADKEKIQVKNDHFFISNLSKERQEPYQNLGLFIDIYTTGNAKARECLMKCLMQLQELKS